MQSQGMPLRVETLAEQTIRFGSQLMTAALSHEHHSSVYPTAYHDRGGFEQRLGWSEHRSFLPRLPAGMWRAPIGSGFTGLDQSPEFARGGIVPDAGPDVQGLVGHGDVRNVPTFGRSLDLRRSISIISLCHANDYPDTYPHHGRRK